MPVNMNVSGMLSPAQLLEKLGLSQAHLDANELGIKINTSDISVFKKTAPEHKIAVPVKASILLGLAGGTASPVLMMALKHSLEAAIKNLIGATGVHGEKVETKKPKFGFAQDAPYEEGDPDEELDEDDNEPKPVVPKTNPPVLEPTPDNSAPAVPLIKADALYQAVKGTSPGSKYFVVAIGDGIKIAARYKNSSLSIRAEGPKLSQYDANLSMAEMAKMGTHASLHLEVGDAKMASRALGAVLSCLNIPFATPVPMVSMIKGGA